MSNLLDRFYRYVGVVGVLALLLIGAVVYMAIAGMPIPEGLQSLAAAAAGYYFGTQVRDKDQPFTPIALTAKESKNDERLQV